jgi:multiple sugar transport system permease protein
VFAASTIAVLPTIAVFVAFQRHFIKGVTSGAIKG